MGHVSDSSDPNVELEDRARTVISLRSFTAALRVVQTKGKKRNKLNLWLENIIFVVVRYFRFINNSLRDAPFDSLRFSGIEATVHALTLPYIALANHLNHVHCRPPKQIPRLPYG